MVNDGNTIQTRLADGDRLLTADEVATLTGYSRQTIYNKVSAGEIPYFKMDGRLRFWLSDISDWIAERAEKGQPTRTGA